MKMLSNLTPSLALSGVRFFIAASSVASSLWLLALPNAAYAATTATTAEARKLTAADREKIRRVISLQIRAFERNEEAVAFSYASPDARRFFGSPRAFMDMVRASYSALYKNTSNEFLEAAVINGVVVQPLKIVTTDGDIIVALYTVEQQADQEWRVGSCELTPSTLQAI